MKYKYVSALAIYLMGTAAVFAQSASGTGSGSSDTPSATDTDIIYGVKSTSGSTQDWGTVNTSTGAFTKISQISPTNLGWPLGDIGSEPDPINGFAYTRQTNNSTGNVDILAIKKKDGSTQWLGLGSDSLVVGYDTKTNKLIYRVSEGSSNTLKSYDTTNSSAAVIGTFGGSSTSWQAGGIGAVDSYGRTAFQLRPNSTSTLYKINLDDGTESEISIGQYITTIAWDSKEQKLYGLYDSNSNGAYRVAVINTTDGTLTNIGPADSIAGMSNYVQLIAPNDQRYYVQEGSNTVRVLSLADGSSIGTFSAPLRLIPPGAIVIGAASGTEVVEYNITAPDTKLIKKGASVVEYSGTNSSTGGVDVEAGTLKVAGSDQLGYGNVSLEGGELELSGDATVTNAISSSDDESSIDTGANTVTISGDVSGSSEINKTGTGTLTLTGALSNSGGLDVNAGTLVANGTGSTPVTITAGRLEGSGSIGSLISNGTIAPGNSIGTLNVSGTVTLNSDSVLVIEVDASGNSDKIIATGAVTAGGSLRVSPENGTYADGQQYTIITGSSVSGTFSSVTVLSCTGTATPSYGSTSITFTLSGCSASRPDNVGTLISYINDLDTSGSSDLQALVAALNNLSGDAYNKAIASLDSNSFSAIRTANLQQLSAIQTMINQRVGANLNGSSSPVTNLSSKNSDLTQDLDGLTFAEKQEVVGRKGPWIRTFYTQSSHKDDDDTGVNGSNFSSGGFTLGYDFSAQNAVYGYAVSYLDGQITANNSEGKNNQTTTVVTGYRANSLANGRTLNLAASMVFNDHSSARDIAFTGVSRTASAKYKSGGLDLFGSFMFAPKGMFGGQSTTELSAGIYNSETEAFTETGAGSLNLTVDYFASSIGRVGAKETIVWNQNALAEDAYIPFASVGLNASGELGAGNASQALSGQSSVITKTQSKIQSDIEVGVGFYRSLKNNGEFSGGVLAKIGQAYTAQEAHLTYRLRF